MRKRDTIVRVLAMCTGLAVAGSASAADNAFKSPSGIDFILIHAGSFMMGSRERGAPANEQPQHRVTISAPFYLARYEVTQAQWEAVMGSSPFDLLRSNSFFDLPGMAARLRHPRHPATVSWNDAQEFIKRLNAREGHGRYRLPTEAEWEYAARAGTTTAFSFGDDAAQLGAHAWHGEDFASGSTHPVGSKRPNPWGLHDVHGNVWEWVQDRYSPQYAATGTVRDPQRPATGRGRVVRGGSWHATGDGWRSASRREYAPDYRGISIGLRLAMTRN